MTAIDKTWGRASSVSWPTFIGCLLILTGSPLLVIYFLLSAFYNDASLWGIWNQNIPFVGPSIASLSLFLGWVAFQVGLYLVPDYLHRFIPGYQGGIIDGAVTPAGNKLPYSINGLQAWLISNSLFVLGAFYFNWFSPTILFDYWVELLWTVNIVGFLLAAFVYVKAYRFPSFPEDRKFSGSALYDFYMGIELNPRIGPIDLKLFFNGRPGIVAWTLINFSFACQQYAWYGHVTNSMILVNFFQLLYVLYFFWKEAWYLKTIDIHHDHFGWMLSWGDLVWLPYMYTLQALFLVFNPIELSTPYFYFVLSLGLAGFYIFATSNNQKDQFRKDPEATIWGKKPECLTCQYRTLDGKTRDSKLLLSGWWGIGRHMNYTGDLLLSLAYSLACGTLSVFPYFYFIFLSILLIHRTLRDEKRMKAKYGSTWDEYTQTVPYRMIPYIW